MSIDRRLNSLTQLDALAKEHFPIASYIADHNELTYQQIAADLGVSRHTVMRVAKQAKLTRTRGRKLGVKWPKFEPRPALLD